MPATFIIKLTRIIAHPPRRLIQQLHTVMPWFGSSYSTEVFSFGSIQCMPYLFLNVGRTPEEVVNQEPKANYLQGSKFLSSILNGCGIDKWHLSDSQYCTAVYVAT